MAELQKQDQAGPDLSVFEKWYPKSASAISASKRTETIEAISKYVEIMTDEEVEYIESLSLPPLKAPA